MADFSYPQSSGGGSGSNASVGTNGAAATGSNTEIGFIDGSGNQQGVSNANPLPTTSTITGTPNVNLAQVAGATTAVGTGASGTGTQRVVLSSDSPLATGAATSSLQTTGNTLLGTIITDMIGGSQLTGLVGGTAIVGKFGIDQTTPGTTNGVQLTGGGTAGTPAGSISTVQGVAGGTPVPVSGTVTAANASVGATGSTAPASATQIGATNPSGNLVSLLTDALSNLNIIHPEISVTGQAAQTATVNNVLTPAAGTAATDLTGYKSFSVQVGCSATAGTFIFEGSNDNTNFFSVPVINQLTSTNTVSGVITATASTICYTGPLNFRYLRLRIASTLTGGSLQAISLFSQMAWSATSFNVSQGTAGNLNVTVPSGVAVTAAVSGTPTIITDVTSAAISATTTSATISPTAGAAYQVNIPVTAISGGITLAVAVQETMDAGTNWVTLFQFPNITTTGSYNSPVMQLTGRSVRYVQTIVGTGSVTRAINREQTSTPLPSLYRSLVDSTIAPITTGSTTASLWVEGTNTYSAIVNQGAGGSAVTFAMDGSDDGANWINGLTNCLGVVGGATPVSMSYTGTAFRFIRVRVVTGIASTTITSVAILGTAGNGQSRTGILTDRSGTTSATPSTSTTLAAYNPTRRYILIQNLGTTAIYINFSSAANTTSSFYLAPNGGSYTAENNFVPTEAITVISTGTSIAYAAKEA